MKAPRISIPRQAARVLDTLHGAGFEAYIVGGCVRDAILGRTPADWDVTTNALPAQVQRLFPRTVPTGIQHGTVTVLTGGEAVEVTTYRVDGIYEDSRHPKQVTFTAQLTEDLARRDFTINAMAYAPAEGLLDPFFGLSDLETKTVRSVGAARERFSEDALRILRAFRFAAQLRFSIAEETLDAASKLAHTLKNISAERIRTELVKLLVSPNPQMLSDMYRAGVTAHFLPEFDRCMETPQNNPHHCFGVGEHILHAVCAVRDDPLLRLTMLLHDIAKPLTRTTDEKGIDHFYGHPEESALLARQILRRLRFDNKTIRRAVNLIARHDIHIGGTLTKERVRRMVHLVGREDFPLLLQVIAADDAAKAPRCAERNRERLLQLTGLYDEILADADPIDLSDLAVNGRDLMARGIAEGADIGAVLERMLQEVLRVPAHNTADYLLSDRQLPRFLREAKEKRKR